MDTIDIGGRGIANNILKMNDSLIMLKDDQHNMVVV